MEKETFDLDYQPDYYGLYILISSVHQTFDGTTTLQHEFNFFVSKNKWWYHKTAHNSTKPTKQDG
jgi:hypothetical protein